MNAVNVSERDGDTGLRHLINRIRAGKGSQNFNRFQLAFEIVGAIFLIWLVNFTPNWFDVLATVGEEMEVKILWEAFVSYIPWLTLLWSGEIALNAFVLARGKWQPATRWVQIGFQLFSIGILYQILSGSALMMPAPVNLLIKGAFLLLLTVSALDAITKSYRLIFPPSTPHTEKFV
ncbi:MAG: hypothetical protein KBG20_16520 [Caldilineaceae bacterium]|nr:hypothetical protein [Caldilineaceae bacterium]MBP8108729.1 hypothetical protein [Caldilineaceae bacterium]MBP8124660.1 hypothetical protein [Caldilineaceae bacterium]MBP9073912.1 hypothetical protein [Caldilineaceae bacterium]